MGEAFRRARACGYCQQEDRALTNWLAPNLLRLMKGTLAGKELNCSSRIPREQVPVGAVALLLLDGDGTARVVSGPDHIGTVMVSSMPLLLAGLADAGDSAKVLTSLAVTISRVDSFDTNFSVVLKSDEIDHAAE